MGENGRKWSQCDTHIEEGLAIYNPKLGLCSVNVQYLYLHLCVLWVMSYKYSCQG